MEPLRSLNRASEKEVEAEHVARLYEILDWLQKASTSPRVKDEISPLLDDFWNVRRCIELIEFTIQRRNPELLDLKFQKLYWERIRANVVTMIGDNLFNDRIIPVSAVKLKQAEIIERYITIYDPSQLQMKAIFS